MSGKNAAKVTGSEEIAAITALLESAFLHVDTTWRLNMGLLRDDPAIGPYRFRTLVRGDLLGTGPGSTAAEVRAALLARAEAALSACEAAGWQLAEYPDMEFTGRVGPLTQTFGGELVRPAEQLGIKLRMTFAVDRPR